MRVEFYALGSWEAAPTFKSSDLSRFLVGGATWGALDLNKVKSRRVRWTLADLLPGSRQTSVAPCLGISLVVTE